MSKSLKFITLMKFLYRFWNLPQLFWMILISLAWTSNLIFLEIEQGEK